MKRILLVQSRAQLQRVEKERENFTRALKGVADLDYLSAIDERLAWTYPDELLRNYDGVIFGGSSDFDFHGGRDERDPARLVSFIILSRVRNIISYVLSEKVPLLGVCFGHQIIAQMYGGNVTNDPKQGKFGSYKVALNEEGKKDKLFSTLPEKFYAQYAHKDSITTLPKGATLLGSAENCQFSILRYNEKAYTLQFHPEIERVEPASGIPADEFHPSPEASNITARWVERIVSDSAGS